MLEQSADQQVEQQSSAGTDFVVSDEYKAIVENKGFKSAEDVLKAYSNLEKMVGNSVRLPSEESSAEDKQAFFDKIRDIDGVLLKDDANLRQKLGTPETADGYQFELKIDDNIKSIAPSLEEEIGQFKNTAHELGLDQKQAEELVKWRLSEIQNMQEALDDSYNQNKNFLKESWGDEFDSKIEDAKFALEQYKGISEEAVNQLANSAIGNNPVLLNVLADLASSMKEKGAVGKNADANMSADNAIKEMSKLRNDPDFIRIYFDSMHPEHASYVKKMDRLERIANGS